MSSPPREDDSLAGRLDDAARAALFELGRTRTAQSGDVLLSEHASDDQVILLTSGRVKVTVATPAGHTAVLGFRGPGALLGEQATFDARPRSATVTAIEPVEYLAIAASDFRRSLRESPDMAIALIAHLSHRLRDADRKRAEHLAGDTTVRVAARLVELAEQYGEADRSGVRIALPLTQGELAGWSGSSLEAVAKALRSLRDAGWVETRRREVVLSDLDALRRLAGP